MKRWYTSHANWGKQRVLQMLTSHSQSNPNGQQLFPITLTARLVMWTADPLHTYLINQRVPRKYEPASEHIYAGLSFGRPEIQAVVERGFRAPGWIHSHQDRVRPSRAFPYRSSIFKPEGQFQIVLTFELVNIGRMPLAGR